MADRITPRSQDFSQWYNDIIQHAQLADQSPVRGCMVLKPNGYAIWEVVQRELDKRFKETGHRNAYFPLLIPESFLNKEKEHVEGFAPQCAVVTHGGGKKLEEPLVIRPTSETIINYMYSKWVQSYRDLPILINQWANVIRWEMRTRPFLRTLEFLWQEGHTCHETEDEARRETLKMLDIYQSFLRDHFAMAVIPGEKTPGEKFPGAENTYCIEAMMQDKEALQAGTSHYFGTKFAQAFDIKFQNREGKQQFVHQTSWGVTTRLIGALIMTHSDDKGLVLPPKAAPTQIVIIPISQKGQDSSKITEIADRLKSELLASYVVHVDAREGHSVGYKFTEWEVQGIPLRIELGPRDLATNECVLARRDGVKTKVSLDQVKATAAKTLDEFQMALYTRSSEFLKANTHIENDLPKFKERIQANSGFYQLHWCGNPGCEAQVKNDTKATIRCIPFAQIRESGKCIVCSAASTGRVIFARNY
ncbi:MAG: proline--tRNA ligase [Deltaproteobacteria bacterium]|nr:proline--tRNA ligase [Deltaproteobacteria bacterium]MBI3293109.1 proline--tRNA ligase [Deltaproteobacteria bacterium]